MNCCSKGNTQLMTSSRLSCASKTWRCWAATWGATRTLVYRCTNAKYLGSTESRGAGTGHPGGQGTGVVSCTVIPLESSRNDTSLWRNAWAAAMGVASAGMSTCRMPASSSTAALRSKRVRASSASIDDHGAPK